MVIGILVFFLGLASKLVLDIDDLRDGDSETQSKAWFRFFTCGPDLAIFAISLFVAVDALRHVVKGAVIDPPAAKWYIALVVFSIIALIVNFALFHLAGANKRIPPSVLVGKAGEEMVYVKMRLDWRQLFQSNECFLVLIVGNLLGLLSLASFSCYASCF